MGGALAAAGFSRQHAAVRLEATGVQGPRNPSSGNAAALGLPGGGTDNLSACFRDAPLSSAPPPRQPTSRALEPPLPLPPPPQPSVMLPPPQPWTPAPTVDVPYPPLSPPPLPPGVTQYWSPPSMPPPPPPRP
ncbi:hypothetical protein E2562_003586 [Oryza meyeriana var. granulata]|uniref:Uncharacterized protein n=1 Tax=Oryza meyeriana var. granulata TaxID=110450 RepID=A0A6G1CLS6_9ORYZ|nr:hypothetical protein E2562_003586 [Oryza meyeriana var. granulata]